MIFEEMLAALGTERGRKVARSFPAANVTGRSSPSSGRRTGSKGGDPGQISTNGDLGLSNTVQR
ncbi:hypothetical protein CO656_20480 [Sinorhizobium sp. FG01]|uniref:Uncharacterized protein n=1 Tax=Sinorhizobium americanum TaxID=194963 RepID=A0A2S3YV56_9HYPH|nr:hypothetical protein CO656_20480 [Sinorhizobium sp. FG01]POH35520.1 hypothetical protein ATY31_01540 [Sinorhizobium americanum]